MKDESQQYIETNRTVYNTIAKHFSDTREFFVQDILPFRTYVSKGDRVLDIGCGNGRVYQLFRDLSISFTGVDQSKGLIAIAKEHFPDARFEVAGMTALPFEDDSFDVLFVIKSFHHLPDDETRIQALSEMKRVLVPGGVIVMVNWHLYSNWVKNKVASTDWEWIGEDHLAVTWKDPERNVHGTRHYWGLTMEELEVLFEKAGLILEKQYFEKKGEESTYEVGENVVSVLKKD